MRNRVGAVTKGLARKTSGRPGAMRGPEEVARLKAELSERYLLPLVKFFTRRGATHADAHDLAQDVFVRALNRPTMSDIANPSAFIFQCASNLLKDRARMAKRREEFAFEVENAQRQAEVFTPERVLLGKQRLSDVMAALNDLPERTRNMVILHRIEGLKYWQIAEQYGISVSAVEKHMIRAMAHLARKVGR